MSRRQKNGPVRAAFEDEGIRVAIADLLPLRAVTASMRTSAKYLKIAASMREVGIIEPPSVARIPTTPGKYLLLDGYLRVDILKSMGVDEVDCLVSIDDEAFTYNKRVNRLATIQEHRMILKAIERGVSEERLARALDIDPHTLRNKMRLLDGICAEAADLLRDKQVPQDTFWIMKRMVPLRQIEAAELMIAMNKYTVAYAQALLAATPSPQLLDRSRRKTIKGLNQQQIALMERESASLDRQFKLAEQSFGADQFDLVLARGYLSKLLSNARVVRHMAQFHQDIFGEFQRVVEQEGHAN